VTGSDEETDAGAGPLDQRIGGDGGTVDEPADCGNRQPDAFDRVEERLAGAARDGRRFEGGDGTSGGIVGDEVGEGAAGVDAEEMACGHAWSL
jgi:hypothetical protein